MKVITNRLCRKRYRMQAKAKKVFTKFLSKCFKRKKQ